ncbi:monooxygenase [Verrucomicrobia bacterium LW23]|nr:monooxygenase [Verrucomicrobia bacterium LW23]
MTTASAATSTGSTHAPGATAPVSAHTPASSSSTAAPSAPASVDCIIAGGGPAGLFLALLLVRQGISVALMEAHGDFDRDFRGDTIHPSTMEVLDELDLADAVLALDPGKVRSLMLVSGTESIRIADFSRLKTRFPYIAMMPQVQLLNVLAREATRFEGFHLLFHASVNRLLYHNGIVNGVTWRRNGTDYEMRAQLVIGADGRASRVRRLAELEMVKTAAPMDVLWFRVPQPPGAVDEQAAFRFGPGSALVLLDRGDQLQVGYILARKAYGALRQKGFDAFRRSCVEVCPALAPVIDNVTGWKDVALLSVECGRLTTWHKPGVLCIGDAAHIMSPAGGIGISYAVQDAVAAANILTEPLRDRNVNEIALLAVQQRREKATRFIQKFQSVIHDNIVASALHSRHRLPLPWFARLLPHIPLLRDMPARTIAFGPQPEHVHHLRTRGPAGSGHLT